MRVSDILNGMGELYVDDGGANYLQLHQVTYFFSVVVNYLISILTVIVIVGVPLIIAMELLYINIPVFQGSVNRAAEGDPRFEKIVGIFLRDAKVALYRANTAETGKSANAVYLGIKWKTVFIAYFLVGLTIGPIKGIIMYMIRVIGEALSSLF